MSRFARQELIQGWNQSTIAAAKVLVVGAGTTGNEVIKNLALLGFGEIIIIDLDKVEEVNLSRSVLFRLDDLGLSKAAAAARMASELNPGTTARGIIANVITDIGNLEYASYDCVILTVDNLEARMWVSRYCWLSSVPYINTGVSGLNGNVAVFFPKDSGCLECSWTPTQYKHISERYSCLRTGIDPLEPKIPMVISSAAIIGGIAAQEAVRIVSQPEDRSARYMKYSGEYRSWLSTMPPNVDQCIGHTSVLNPPDRNRWLSATRDEVVDDVARRLMRELGTSTLQIQTDKPLVTQEGCRSCGTVVEIPPVWLANYRRRVCLHCLGIMTPRNEVYMLEGEMTFEELAFPSHHLLAVAYERDGQVQESWLYLR